jgi:hypothetical protein
VIRLEPGAPRRQIQGWEAAARPPARETHRGLERPDRARRRRDGWTTVVRGELWMCQSIGEVIRFFIEKRWALRWHGIFGDMWGQVKQGPDVSGR